MRKEIMLWHKPQEEVLKILNLSDYKEIQIKKLSRGLRQKLGIASVIIDEPDVLILDEPVSALDPLGRNEIFDIILKLKGRVTVIFSSHILNDVERICDHVVLINKGKIILNKDINDLSLDKNVVVIKFKSREDLMVVKELLGYECKFNENIENCLEIYNDDVLEVENKVFQVLYMTSTMHPTQLLLTTSCCAFYLEFLV